VFRCDGRVYEIVWVQGEGCRLVEATPEEVTAWREEHAGELASISLPVDDVRACFEGPTLARCQKIASLGPGRFLILFGQARKDPRYGHGAHLRLIGTRIPAPLPPLEGGCGACVELATACERCARRLVAEALATAPYRLLRAAAQHVDPTEQLRAARQLRVAELSKQRPANRRTRAISPWDRPRGRPSWS
jgi:hypothetical protein